MNFLGFKTAAIAASTLSVVAFAAPDAQALSFTVDLRTGPNGQFSSRTFNNLTPDGLSLTIQGGTRGGDARDLDLRNGGVGVVGGDNNRRVDGAAGRPNDELIRLIFSESVRFTEITFNNVDNGDDSFTLVSENNGNLFTNEPLLRTLQSGDGSVGIFSVSGLPFDNIFEIQARQPNNSFRVLGFRAETVPTPALLPGVIGMGVAALRKRKQASAEEASS